MYMRSRSLLLSPFPGWVGKLRAGVLINAPQSPYLMKSIYVEREEKRWRWHKNVKPLFCTFARFPDPPSRGLRSINKAHFPVSHTYQFLKGRTIQLLMLQERMSQPVELIVVLTQHRLRHIIALVEQALHLQIDHCRHARPARFAGRSVHRDRSVLRRRRVAAVQQKPPGGIGDERLTVR